MIFKMRTVTDSGWLRGEDGAMRAEVGLLRDEVVALLGGEMDAQAEVTSRSARSVNRAPVSKGRTCDPASCSGVPDCRSSIWTPIR